MRNKYKNIPVDVNHCMTIKKTSPPKELTLEEFKNKEQGIIWLDNKTGELIFKSKNMKEEFDETKENDKEYLKEYYQSKIDYWEDKPNSELIVKKYKKALKKLNK